MRFWTTFAPCEDENDREKGKSTDPRRSEDIDQKPQPALATRDHGYYKK